MCYFHMPNVSKIEPEKFVQLIENKSEFENVIIIDCRSQKEFDGGHIKNAILSSSSSDKDDIYKKIWKPNSIFIFHCEFSVHRGPTTWKKFINIHKKSQNKSSLLNAFVLKGGF